MKLIVLGDSCSGVPGHRHEMNLQAVAEALTRRAPVADALCFLGDHVAGYVTDEHELRSQWSRFLGREFPPIKSMAPRVFHIPGNHDCYDATSARVYEEMLPVDGRNDVIAQKGLNYAVRDGQALLVFLNTANAADRGTATLDLDWLTEVLARSEEVEVTLVFGHHPILPVNGYIQPLRWCIEPGLGRSAWSLMRKRRVQAYICSHIIAFDFQVRDGMIQLCSGGAGTEYGPSGAMPGPVEYQHFVTVDACPQALSFRTFDKAGSLREHLSWPPSLEAVDEAFEIKVDRTKEARLLADPAARGRVYALRWRIETSTVMRPYAPFEIEGTFAEDASSALVIDRELESGRVRVTMRLPGMEAPQTWLGPELPPNTTWMLEIIAYRHAGPTAIVARLDGKDWNSFTTCRQTGLEDVVWPGLWRLRTGEQQTVSLQIFVDRPA